MTTEPATLYKVLRPDGSCYHGGAGAWPLPTADGPGDWLPALTGQLIACAHGYHLVRLANLLDWVGPALFEAEYAGEIGEAVDKVVVRQARLLRRVTEWNDRTLRR